MKSNLPQKTIFSFLLVFSSFLNAQDFQGKAYYESKTTIDMTDFGSADMSEEQKKQIAERMKSMLEKTFILTFNKEESIYKEEEKLEAPNQGGGFRMMSNFTGGEKYKNVKRKIFLQEQEFFGKQFLIKDSLENLEWSMTAETKQIGNYLCYKATAVKKVDDMDFRSMRIRNRDNEENEKKQDSKAAKDPMDVIEVPKEIEVNAWYTLQIPINQGPDDYWGLPGLILEINADRTTILCSKIVLNPEEKEALKAPEKGEEVTKNEFNDIMKKKVQEMREMYGGRGRDGNRMRTRG